MSAFLLIEDKDEFANKLLTDLAELGLSAERAASGEQAMKLLKANSYDGVILDLRLESLPSPQGLQILEWVKKNRSETVVVVVTAYEHLGFRALELGVDALLYKPVEAQHVLNYMLRAIELRRLRLENQSLKEAIASGIMSNPFQMLEHMCSRFHIVARQLRHRYSGRATIEITDEYDVQDLLHGVLRLFFDDIRPEEWTPTYAGGAARVDFLLKKQQIIIEVKKTRSGFGAKQLGEQLIIDIARYKSHPDCKTLYCFVYDPEGNIANPQGIENDLSHQGGDFEVKVYIAPSAV
jgi:ActR/RegA family two-component response regulator